MHRHHTPKNYLKNFSFLKISTFVWEVSMQNIGKKFTKYLMKKIIKNNKKNKKKKNKKKKKKSKKKKKKKKKIKIRVLSFGSKTTVII